MSPLFKTLIVVWLVLHTVSSVLMFEIIQRQNRTITALALRLK
jgi:hypothetical protein